MDRMSGLDWKYDKPWVSFCNITLTVLFSLYCLIRATMILKKYPIQLRNFVKGTIKRLWLNPIGHYISIIPIILYLGITRDEENHPYFHFISNVFLGLAGFSNALVYIYQRKEAFQEKEKEETVSLKSTYVF